MAKYAVQGLDNTLNQNISFNNLIPFSSMFTDLGTICYTQNRLTNRGIASYVTNYNFSIDSTNKIPGGTAIVRILADGITGHIPVFNGFKVTSGSASYNNISGIYNVVIFFYDGLDYWVSIFQEANATGIDIVSPTLLSAIVSDSLRNKLVLTYNESLSGSISQSDFQIGIKNLTSAVVSGSSITLTTDSNFIYSDVISLNGGSNKIQDLSGNISNNLVSQSVTNQITNLIFLSGSVLDSSRNSISGYYNKTINSTVIPSISDYGVSGKTINSFNISGSNITIGLNTPFAVGDVIQLTYTSGINKLQDLYGSIASNLVTQSIINNITLPVFNNAYVSDTLRTRIVIVANKTILSGSTTISDFNVSGGKTITGFSTSGININIDVNSAYLYGDVINVSYSSSAGKLQDQYGSLLPTFSNQSVTNNIQTWLGITYNTTNNIIASGSNWNPTANIGTTNFGQTGIMTTKKLNAGQDGGIRQIHNSTTGFYSIIGLKTTNSIGGYSTFLYGAYSTNGNGLNRVENGVVTAQSGIVLTNGEKIQLYRNSGTVKLQKIGTDGVTVTDIYTFTTTNNTDLYAGIDIRGDAKANTPESYYLL